MKFASYNLSTIEYLLENTNSHNISISYIAKITFTI